MEKEIKSKIEDLKLEENVKDSSNTSRKSIAATYIESTTIHGLSPIYSAEHLYMRLFWLTLFAAALGLMIWQITQLIDKVTSNDIVTTSQVSYHKTLPYPAITLCNSNPFQKSKVESFGSKIDSSLSDSDLYNLGQSKEEFLIKGAKFCRIAGNECNYERDFGTISSGSLGNCFTWKSNQTQKGPSPDEGFSVVLNLNAQEYSIVGAKFFSTKGALVALHSPEETMTYLRITSKAILLSPGTLTQLKIRKQTIKRLPAPYPDGCFKSTYFLKKFMGLSLKNSFKYTAELCQELCGLITDFRCRYVPVPAQNLIKKLFSASESNFLFNETGQSPCKPKKNKECNCKPPCKEEIYQFSTSSAQWPHPSTASEAVLQVKSSPSAPKTVANWTTKDAYNNLVALTVYFDDFTVAKIEQKPAYGWNNFLSDLGGQMGLWIGASVYSGFELFSLFINLMAYLFCRNKQVAT